MHQITWLVLRRMRAPLLLLICTYAICILGLVLAPGLVVDGSPSHLSIFHAVYVISYVATTIGFGELPTEFSDAQRLWAIISMYMSVIAWVYSIGAIIRLLQDPNLRAALTEIRFARSVRRIREPFFLVCGYGETGQALVQSLTNYFIHVVVVDIDPDRINELSLLDQGYHVYVPGLCADASLPETLFEAGLGNPYCKRVIALTGDDSVNLQIAITTRLMRKDAEVVCRADNEDIKRNMASFGTDVVINPFEAFGRMLSLALHSPEQYILQKWLMSESHAGFGWPKEAPKGVWILCGFGRFGRALYRCLQREEIEAVIIDVDPDLDYPVQHVVGRGTEAVTLREARIAEAVGIVAGTDSDANNLSIIMTAREVKPDLFIVARKNKEANQQVFDALNADVIMRPSQILADEIRNHLTAPLLMQFIDIIRRQDRQWSWGLLSRLYLEIGMQTTPDIWELKISGDQAPEVIEALERDRFVSLQWLLGRGRQEFRKIVVIPLLLLRGDESMLLPAADTLLQEGDRLLFCGGGKAYQRMRAMLQDYYIFSGNDPTGGLLGRWLASTWLGQKLLPAAQGGEDQGQA